jgi:hypothetical protein
VVLLMTMKECFSWVIRHKLDFGSALRANEHDIFPQTMHLKIALELAHFKGMSVKMHRVIVCAKVFQNEPVALPRFEDWLVGLRVRLSIDPP